MTDTSRSDDALATDIRSGGAKRDSALRALYLRPGLREAVTRHVLDNGGSRQDAQDVFQEALVLLDRNVRDGRYQGKSLLATYFVGIAKWHWVTLRRQRGRFEELSDAQYETGVESVEAAIISEEHRNLLVTALAKTGERCRALLRLYQLEHSMEEIATLMGYNNADVAKKEAYRCRMRLREVLENQPEFADLLDRDTGTPKV